MTANSRRWWQYFFSRYGNWGGPGWSAGCWNPMGTDWNYPAIDAIDELFKHHDSAYQHEEDLDVADAKLVKGLRQTRASGIYAKAYRVGAIFIFTVWPIIRSVFWRNNMKKYLVTLLAVMTLAFLAPPVLGGSVPPVAASDFAVAATEAAHPIWSFLAGDGFWGALVIGVVSFVWRWLRPYVLAQAKQRELENMFLACEAFVANSMTKYTERYKAANADGKLTRDEAEEIFYNTKQDFVLFMQSQGRDVVKLYGDRFIDAMIEFIVSRFNMPKAVSIPLSSSPASAPLPSSVTDGTMPA